jgi:hypothetical protein
MAFTDTFTDTADTFLENHTPSGGTAWTRVDGVAGGGKIATTILKSQTGGTATSYRCDDQGSANHYVQYKTNNAGSSYVCNRLTNISNFIGVRRGGGGVIECFKCVAGVQTQLGSDGSVAASGDVLRLESSGDVHTVYKNGVLESGVGGTDSFNNTETRQGVACFASSATNFCDDFEAGALAGTEELSGSASTGGQTAPSLTTSVPL